MVSFSKRLCYGHQGRAEEDFAEQLAEGEEI